MAEAEYRIGELKFETEEEYLATKADLEKIKDIMTSYNTKTPDGAQKALDAVAGEGGFTSDYGRKFTEKLKKTAGIGTDKTVNKAKNDKPAGSGKPGKTGNTVKKTAQETVKKTGSSSSVHIITKKNIAVVAVAVLLVCVVVLGLKLSGVIGGKDKVGGDNEMRNLVMGYAANQVSLKSELYNYYLNVQGLDDARAQELAATDISTAYAMDVTVLNLESVSDEYIEKIYTALVTAGDIENGAYNEPAAVTELKNRLSAAGAVKASDSSSGADAASAEPEKTEDALKVNLINQLMDYEQRVAAALNYEYSHFGMDDSEISEYVIEDMEQTFDKVLYDMTLTDEEKIMYFDSLITKGLFEGGKLVRFDSDPAAYELPNLTPSIYLVTGDEKERLTCIQESVAPVYSVAYRLTDGSKEGYLIFRSNENMSVVLNDDSGNGTFMQGDVLLNWGGKTTLGEWYYNSGKIGFAIGDDLGDGIEYIYEIVY